MKGVIIASLVHIQELFIEQKACPKVQNLFSACSPRRHAFLRPRKCPNFVIFSLYPDSFILVGLHSVLKLSHSIVIV